MSDEFQVGDYSAYVDDWHGTESPGQQGKNPDQSAGWLGAKELPDPGRDAPEQPLDRWWEERFGALSSAAIRRVIDAGEAIIQERAQNGIFE